MNIYNRLSLLSAHLGISLEQFRQRAYQVANAGQEPNRYPSRTAITYAFSLTRSERGNKRPAAGAADQASEKLAALIGDTFRECANELGLKPVHGLGLDTPLKEFLTALNVPEKTVVEHFAENEKSIYEYWISRNFRKSDFIPQSLEMSLDQIKQNYFRGLENAYFSIYRFRGKHGDQRKLVEEKLTVHAHRTLLLSYEDHRGILFKGVGFVGGAKMSGILTSISSDHRTFDSVFLHLFMDRLNENELGCYLVRNFGPDVSHMYKSIAFERSEQFTINAKIDQMDVRVIRYLDVIDNSFASPTNLSSFEVTLSDYRRLLPQGIMLHDAYLSDYNSLRRKENIYDVRDELKSRLKQFADLPSGMQRESAASPLPRNRR